MDWTRPVGVLAVLVICVTVIGTFLTLAIRLFTGVYAVSAILVLILVSVSVVGMVRSGVVSSRFLSNPYW
jgi:F0F1-type ATP synthase membrane subunit a